MLLLLTLVHITTALLLILFVLIQDSKGDGVFGMGGGGGSNQLMSSTGAANFLVKATRGLAIFFAATSIGLTYITSRHTGSVVDDFTPNKPVSGAMAPAPTGSMAAQAATPTTDKSADTNKATDAKKPAESSKPATPAPAQEGNE